MARRRGGGARLDGEEDGEQVDGNKDGVQVGSDEDKARGSMPRRRSMAQRRGGWGAGRRRQGRGAVAISFRRGLKLELKRERRERR